jgi:hypothetical protein
VIGVSKKKRWKMKGNKKPILKQRKHFEGVVVSKILG